VVHETGMDFSENKTISFCCWDSKPRSSNPWPSHYTDYVRNIIMMIKSRNMDLVGHVAEWEK